MVSDAVYQAWLRDPSAPCGHLVQLGYRGTSAVYPSWVDYTLLLSDFPRAGYQNRIHSLPAITRQIGDDLLGMASASIGELVLDNVDGALDAYPQLSLDGQPALIYQGHPDWLTADFRLLYSGVNEMVASATQELVTVHLRGPEHGANAPLQTQLVPPAVGSTAPSNTPVPKAYGNVFNAAPACVDEANQVYRWNDGAITAVTAVRDGGIPFRTRPLAIASVDTDTLSFLVPHGFVKVTRVRCDLGSLPVATQWGKIIWAETQFVAVAYNTAIAATSPDGIKWTQRTLPSTAFWLPLVSTGVALVAIGSSSGQCARSVDGGVTWTAITMPSADWTAAAWNGTRIVVVSADGFAYSSDNHGLTWTSRTMPSLDAWQNVVRVGTGFVAISSSTGAPTALSADGITWISGGAMPSSGPAWGALAYSGSVLVCIAGGGGSSDAAYSLDGGANWLATSMPSSVIWSGVAYSGEGFCAVALSGTKAATSLDGIAWTPQVLPASTDWNTIAFGNGVYCAIGISAAYATVSTDGISWTGVQNTLPAPLAVNTDYWVLAEGWTPTQCKLTATFGSTIAVSLTTTTAGAVLVGYHWSANVTQGYLYLDSRPAFGLTLDGVAGSTAAATILPTLLAATSIDAASQAAFAVTCAQPQGLYVRERANRLDLAALMLRGLGAWANYGRAGALQFGRLEASYAAHTYELFEDQFEGEDSFGIERLILPAKQHRLGYRRNWTDQTGALASGVSAEARGLYSTDYSLTPIQLGLDEGPAGEEFHLLAGKPDFIESLFTYGDGALIEAARRNTLFYGWLAIYRGTVGLVGSQFDPGVVVRINHSRYGCAAGVRMACIAVEDRPSERLTNLKFLCALPAFTPGQL